MEFKKIERQFAPENQPLEPDRIADNVEKIQEPDPQQDEISSAYENRDMFQVIDQVSTLELGQALPGGDDSITPNREFPDLFMRFVEAVSDFNQSRQEPAANDPRILKNEPLFKKPDE